MRAAIAELFFERFPHAIDVAVLAEDERQYDPVVACAHLAVSAVVAHEGAAGPGGSVGKREGDRMTLRRIAPCAVTCVTCREQSAAGDGLGSFAYNHAVHDHQVAGLEVDECELVLRRDVLGDKS